MSPLHIKLGIMKQSVPGVMYHQDLFPAKVTAGLFVKPQTDEIIEYKELLKKLERKVKAA